MVKAMQADGLEWSEGYRPLGRQALAEIIDGRMAKAVDRWLDSLTIADAPSRRVAQRNGLPVDRITEVRVLDPYYIAPGIQTISRISAGALQARRAPFG